MTMPTIIKALDKSEELQILQSLLFKAAYHDPAYWQQHGRWWRAAITTRRKTIKRELTRHLGHEPSRGELEYLIGPPVEIGGVNV